jgi:hypothetical protein
MNNPSSPRETSELARSREEFLASRKAAGRAIDIETCTIWSEHCNLLDPYGVDLDSDCCIESVIFVRSAESDGPIYEEDLPEDKYHALCARIDRTKQTPTTAEGVRDVLLERYACAVAALDEVIEDVIDDRLGAVPLDIVRSGVLMALAKLGKQGTSQQERLERKFRAKSPTADC